MGIVNGTTNYMLTRMNDDGLSYDDALAEAVQMIESGELLRLAGSSLVEVFMAGRQCGSHYGN